MDKDKQRETTLVDGVEYITEDGILCDVYYGRATKLVIPDNVRGVTRRISRYSDSHIQEIVFPDTVENLPRAMFEEFVRLQSVRLPAGIVEIPEKLFSGCGSLSTITIPESVISIGENAFYICWRLTEITIPQNVTSIGACAFSGCWNLCHVTLPDGLMYIDRGAFKECSKLEEIRIPDGVKTLSWSTFQGCKKLKRIYHSSDLVWTGEWFDVGGYDVETVTVPEGVEVIGESACWEYAALKELILPKSLERIRYGAFNMCRSLQRIAFSERLKSIEDIAFRECVSLFRLALPTSLTNIGKGAFEECRSLTEVEIPASVETIGANAFSGCTGLVRVRVCNPACRIHPTAFKNCHGLTSFVFEGEGRDEILHYAYGFTIENETLKDYSGLAEEVSVPNCVKKIGVSAFRKCSHVTRVTLGDSVTEIGRFAFEGCTSLCEMDIPASVDCIRGALFKDGTASLKITFGGSSAEWEAMMKQEENIVNLYYDDGYHRGRGLHIKYKEFYPIFYSEHEDFSCEVYCRRDGKTLTYSREDPIPNVELEKYDDGA